ncbi:MAG: hypothetical protein ABJO09_07635 [Hyphomicrobiales bacterium]
MAFDGVVLRNALKFTEILHNTEIYSAAKMQAYQRRLLKRLVYHAKAEVPFYETRLNPLFGPKDEIRWEAWKDIPIFSRAEAQAAGDALFARNTPPQTGNYSTQTTSGSTGMPLTVRRSALTSIMSAAINQRIFNWHNVNCDGTIAFIFDDTDAFPYPDGLVERDWNLKNKSAQVYQLSIGCTVNQQIEWLVRNAPDILGTYPQNARAIVEQMQRSAQPISFQTLICHGEVLGRETRQVIEGAGIKIIDRFGGEDIGVISANCPNGTWHHQFSEVGLMEIVADDGQTILKTGMGALVGTPLYNYAMPFIRYRNGDQIELSSTPCSCGRTLPRIESILGRDRNVFTFSDGSQVWPDMNQWEYAPFLPAKQFQVIQHAPTEVEVLYVPSEENAEVDESGFSKLLRAKLHSDILVKLTKVQALERAPSGKFETWKSYVNAS